VASTRVQGWGDEAPNEGVWGGAVPLLRKCFCFVISKWHILVNFEVLLNLKYVIILDDVFIDVPQPKYWGCVPGIPVGVDECGAFAPPKFGKIFFGKM